MIEFKEEFIRELANRVKCIVENYGAAQVCLPFFNSVLTLREDGETISDRWFKVEFDGDDYIAFTRDFLNSDKVQEWMQDCIENRLTELGKKKLTKMTIYNKID